MSTLRTAVISASLGAAAAMGGSALSQPAKADLYEPVDRRAGQFRFVCVEDAPSCPRDGGAVAWTPDGGSAHCWQTFASFEIPSTVAGVDALKREHRSPSAPEAAAAINQLVDVFVAPAVAEDQGLRVAP